MREIFFGSKIEVLKILHQMTDEKKAIQNSPLTLSPNVSPI